MAEADTPAPASAAAPPTAPAAASLPKAAPATPAPAPAAAPPAPAPAATAAPKTATSAAKKVDEPVSVDTIFKDDYVGGDPYQELEQLDEMEENSNYQSKEKEALTQPMRAAEMKKFEKNEKNLLDEIITGTGIKKSVG